MAYKILEANGVDNENVDGAALNHFIARNKSGIIGGVLSECALTATGSQVGISPGLLMICGIRVKITDMEMLGISALPVEPTKYQIVAQVMLTSNGDIDFSLFLQLPATLAQDELYVSNSGRYQIELGRFTHETDGSISGLTKTINTISDIDNGGTSGIVEWDGTAIYKKGDVVYRDGNIYLCIADEADGDPPETLLGDSWELISKGEKPRGELSIIATFNITEANTVITLQNLVGMSSIDWGDGTVDNSLTHTYTAIGEYTCKIYGCTEIGFQAFMYCNTLTRLIIKNGVKRLSTEAFKDCANLTNVKISDSVTAIWDFAFRNCGFTSITIPNSVTSMGTRVFFYCSSLKTVIINATTPPSNKGYIFQGSTAIEKIIVPTESLEAYKTAESWSDYAMLIDCYLPSEYYAKLNEINTFTQPFKMQYSDCYLGLYSNSIYIGDTPDYTGIWSELTKDRLYLRGPDCATTYRNSGSVSIYEGDAHFIVAFPRKTGTLATQKDVDDADARLKAELNGEVTIITVDTTTGYKEVDFNSVNSVIGVTTVDWGDGTVGTDLAHTYSESGVFKCKIYGMTTVTSATGATHAITEIVIGKSVTELADEAFINCMNLKKVTFNSGTLPKIGRDVFHLCFELSSIIVPAKSLADYKNALPNYRTIIDSYVLASQLPKNEEKQYELIEKIIIGYFLTTAQPEDWETNYTAYFTNTGTAREPIYTAVMGDSVPTWESGKYYSFDGETAVNFERNVEPDGTEYSFKKVIFYAATTQGTGARNGYFHLKSDINQYEARAYIPYIISPNGKCYIYARGKIANGRLFVESSCSNNNPYTVVAAGDNTMLLSGSFLYKQNVTKIKSMSISTALLPKTEIYILAVRA